MMRPTSFYSKLPNGLLGSLSGTSGLLSRNNIPVFNNTPERGLPPVADHTPQPLTQGTGTTPPEMTLVTHLDTTLTFGITGLTGIIQKPVLQALVVYSHPTTTLTHGVIVQEGIMNRPVVFIVVACSHLVITQTATILITPMGGGATPTLPILIRNTRARNSL